ncbi:MAG: hypothetical protein AAFU84_15040 [Cyanobacteria bacterium J06633_23]
MKGSSLFDEAHIKLAFLGLRAEDLELVQNFFEREDGKVSISTFKDLKSAREAIIREEINSVVIDIFNIGERNAANFIKRIRESRRTSTVSFCLCGKETQLESLENLKSIPSDMRKRFRHYYKFALDARIEVVKKNALYVTDLFIADAVKVLAFDEYNTLIRAFREPVGLWDKYGQQLILACATIIAACITATAIYLSSSNTKGNQNSTPAADTNHSMQLMERKSDYLSVI